MKDKVSVGITSIVLFVLGVLPGIIAIITKAIQEGTQIAVNGPEKWLLYITIGSGALLAIGRYVQAAIQSKQNEKVKFVPIPHNAAAQLPAGEAMPTVDLMRHLAVEHPEAVEQLKTEGVIT